MSKQVGPRQILIALLAHSSWDTKPLEGLVKEMAEVAASLRRQDVPAKFVAHATNRESYWSDDASYELGLLFSMGLVSFEGGLLRRTDADYEDMFDVLCADLEVGVREALRTAVVTP